jgi:hypothetical protein
MWFLVATAWAAEVPLTVTPVLAPPDAPAQYAEFAAAAGKKASLACDTLWTSEVLLCFKVTDGKKRRWVTDADLAAWKTDLAALRASVTERAKAELADQPDAVKVDGTEKTYWLAAEGDGWSAAGILQPALLAEKLGTPTFLVATPAEGIAIYWPAGDRDLDRIVAVGAKEMFESKEGPVTALVHQWTGSRWVTFGEAIPVAPAIP